MIIADMIVADVIVVVVIRIAEVEFVHPVSAGSSVRFLPAV